MVLGLGKSGQSVVRYFSEHNIPCVVADTRAHPPGLEQIRREFPQLEIVLGPLEQTLLCSVAQIVLSPGISIDHPLLQQALEAGVEVVGDVELFARQAKAPVVAITGSNGKSTVTTLVGEMANSAGLKVRVGGNLGTPALELLKHEEPDLYVLELSSFQLESIQTLEPVAAVVLNISADHLDRYRSLQHYAQVKGQVYLRAVHWVYPAEDEAVVALMESLAITPQPQQLSPYYSTTPVKPGWFGLCKDLSGAVWICQGEQPLIAVSELQIFGTHNVTNVVAAMTLAEAAGVPLAAMVAALQQFSGLPHRTEWVAESRGVRWINDSKGTNVGATEAAIKGLGRPDHLNKLVLIAGGQGKEADFSPLKVLVKDYVRSVILMGEDAKLIESALGGVTPVYHVATMEEAVVTANRIAEPGDTILLSPACASFDQFSGFEARGDAYKQAVQKRLQKVVR
ncbi:MAG: UDP-N-acetylmuramoyl-L-alanine--D-glutamate ligase [Gammaproteobacteria bacterium]|nr:UDP-N-acetylmuramoyl-L-alanine--D-glutamate ligase [Gammaproteobacteria bacterium]MBT3489737.1 UDP-N-acetylmuramoyl-L-alanine--D-glutamate ligase [Gammaproteobacteria bacterium]MBT3719698.1 UDP-N-acetylmuramoyl-L-alanine--D-glutamate ligase [Gammaproteobacteria bacterium]MBT3845472.1 UDP-N-acetylmuramoyl-L-alanine--D-glutamate ligase [Gammaproteobacteria bacterium]MBT3892875.1 UDP-N-acetylmuramoyl-L-alanine--D-glutamate ligase [Gammaproteobacteria bacterium]